MKLLLDTHAFLWFILDSPQLSSVAKRLIEDEENEVFMSMASLWEMAVKVSLGKLTIPVPFEQFIPHQILINDFLILPITVPHVQYVAQLPFWHRDPFDRLLVAQCIIEEMIMVSRDRAFDDYGVRRTWASIPD